MLGLAAVTAAAGLAVAGCAPVKMGAAAVVGNNSVSIAQLDTYAGMLTTAQKKHPSPQGSLTQQQITQSTLAWLINFHISDQLASQNGITVSPAQESQALSQLVKGEQEEAEQEGESPSSVTLSGILVANGIAPGLQNQLGRWLAIEDAYVASADGGKAPTTQAGETALQDKFDHATCVAAKSLNIQVNPQFGRMSYASVPYAVVAAADTVSRPSGASPSASPSGLTPAC
jgi:hypothetical protein